jgi:peptide/nickel transport system permease protein
MLRFLFSLLLRAFTTLLAVLLIAFSISRVAYRDPALMLAPRNANAETIAAIARALHLDAPWWRQLWWFLYRGPGIAGTPSGLVNWPPSLGYSFHYQAPVTQLIVSKVPVTLSLGLGAIIIWMTLAILGGLVAVRRPEGWLDHCISVVSYAGLSLPTFLSGILLSFFLFYQLSTIGISWFPSSGYVPLHQNPLGWARHLLLPWATLTIAEVGLFQRIVRASLLDVLGADYIRTARAKGVRETRVLFSHALKAALNPVITLGGLELAGILGGAIVTEQIFGLDGVGRLAISAALAGDFPVVIGTTIFASAVFIICTLLVDLVTHMRDPRRRARANR